MKIILHMGMPKTGTTSLQVGLDMMRQELLAEGCFYPDPGRFTGNKFQHVLAAFFGDFNLLEPELRKRYATIDNALSNAEYFLREVKYEYKKYDKHSLILSSEFLSRGNKHQITIIRKKLETITDNIVPVVYIREAASLFKSEFQEDAKRGHFLKPYPPKKLQQLLTNIAEIFGRKPIVRPLHPAQLVGGDILKDFWTEVLGLGHRASKLPTISENTSMSAEATAALIYYLDLLRERGLSMDNREARFLYHGLRWFDDADNRLTKLQLKPEAARDIRAAAVEYVWLREEYGIEFPELVYHDIDERNVEKLKKYNKLTDIIDIDPEKLAWLVFNGAHDKKWARGDFQKAIRLFWKLKDRLAGRRPVATG